MMKVMLVVLAICFTAAHAGKVKITGKVVCKDGGTEGDRVVVKLIDQDKFGIDDKMGEKEIKLNSENEATFEVEGHATDSYSKIDPILRVLTTCKAATWGYWRELEWIIPDKYIDGETYRMSTIDLELEQPDESIEIFS